MKMQRQKSYNTINNAITKRENRLRVLELIATHPGISRADISKKVALSRMSLTNITGYLIQQGLVEEENDSADAFAAVSAGRKKIGLHIGRQSPVVVGIWISRDGCRGVLASLGLRVLASMQLEYDSMETVDSLMDKAVRILRALAGSTERPICGVGVSCVGPINSQKCVILNPPDFFGAVNVPVGEILRKESGLPVFMHNDMNASALAEKYFGRGKEASDFAYLGISNGVGAGVIWNGRLFEGRNGFTGEIGHTTIDRNGELCHCGNRGCLELYTNTSRIIARLESSAKRRFQDFQSAMAYCEESDAGEEILKNFEEPLTIGLTTLCNIVDPAFVVIGHYGAHLPDRLLERVEDGLNRRILSAGNNRIEIVKSAFGADSPMLGAASIIIDKVFTGVLNLFHDSENEIE